MAMWRPISGSVLMLDPSLATPRDIEDYLTEHRIIARAAAGGDDSYQVEVAVTGRRRRVACLNEEGEVVAGPSLAEFVESMDNALRKLQIDIGGRIAWGDIDLGEVDIEGDDFEPEWPALHTVEQEGVAGAPDDAAAGGRAGAEDAARGAAADARAGAPAQAGAQTDLQPGTLAASSPVGTQPGALGGVQVGLPVPADSEAGLHAEDDEVEGEIPDFGQGPMLALSDVSFAVLPGAAASLETTIAAFDACGATAVVADTVPPQAKSMAGNSSFVVAMSADAAGLDAPVFVVRADGVRLTWTWTDRLQPLPWVEASEAARHFAEAELGVGAFTSRIAACVPQANVEIIRLALIGHPGEAPARLAAAFGLPREVADCLGGLLPARVIPGAVVFEPKPFGARLQSSVAQAVAGERPSDMGLLKMYRKVNLERPRLTEVLASVQAGVGVLALAGGLRSWRRASGKILAVLGGAFVVNAGARILTVQWIGRALETEGLSVSRHEPEAVAEADLIGDGGLAAGGAGLTAGNGGPAADGGNGGLVGGAGRAGGAARDSVAQGSTELPDVDASGVRADGASKAADAASVVGAADAAGAADASGAAGATEAAGANASGAPGADESSVVEPVGMVEFSDVAGPSDVAEPAAPEPADVDGALVPEPDQATIEAFWTRARNVARIAPLEAVMGQDDRSSLCPPAFAFGDTPELADRLAELIVAGKKTATSSWLPAYEASGLALPSAGDLSIMCDGRGRPVALLSNTDVEVVPFDQAGSEVAQAEGEGSFEQWKAEHEAFFASQCRELGIGFDRSGSVVVEHFKVVYWWRDGVEGVASMGKADEPSGEGAGAKDPEAE